MKGIIKENLGDSRYIVGVKTNVEPANAIREDLNQKYDDNSQKLIKAQGEWLEAKSPYEALLAEIEAASSAYQACINTFNLSACIDAKLAACEDAYNDCELECSKIESAPGECDLVCQQARDACKAACQRQRDACRAVAEIECQEAYQAALTACQTQWAPAIAELHSQAAEALVPVQAALIKIAELEAQQLSLARRINEIETVEAREEQITCFRAQYKSDLEAETEVEVARTPSGRTVITEIAAPGVCLQDSRVLPSGHVYVNSAIYPGFETWRPTWRTGIVKAILTEDNKLQVEVKDGTLAGGLGTLYTRNPIDCTPPQAYFDGNWQAAEASIKAARNALTAAQAALQDAAKVRDDCIAQYDATWQNACYTDKAAACEIEWANWLDLCNESSLPDCLEQYQAGLAACYAQAQAECISERDALIAQCRADYQPAVDAAQTAVDAAAYAMTQELVGIYQPASPLVLDLPVEHCVISSYQIGDEVLIDFPVRTGGESDPMAVWNSARVIGWASETRQCAGFTLTYAGFCSVEILSMSMVKTFAEAEAIYNHLRTGRYVIQAARHASRASEPTYVDYPLSFEISGNRLVFGDATDPPYIGFRMSHRSLWTDDKCGTFGDDDPLPLAADVFRLNLTDYPYAETTNYAYIYFRLWDTEIESEIMSGAVRLVNPYTLPRGMQNWLRFSEIRVAMADSFLDTALDYNADPSGCWIEIDCTTWEGGAPPIIPITLTSLAEL